IAEIGLRDRQIERHALVGEDDRLGIAGRSGGVRELKWLAELLHVVPGVGALGTLENLVQAPPVAWWLQSLPAALRRAEDIGPHIGLTQDLRGGLVHRHVI